MERDILENNYLVVTGELTEDFTFSHEVFGEGFYQSKISVVRESGTVDLLPIIVSERLVDVKEKWVGQFVKIYGQFRSFNYHENEKNRLVLSVFVRELEVLEVLYPQNEIVLDGYICKAPIYRKTSLGREIADVLIAVNRNYGKSDYIPCILWGRTARFASTFEVGTRVLVTGRIQSRDYIKKLSEELCEKRTAYEVSVSKVEM